MARQIRDHMFGPDEDGSTWRRMLVEANIPSRYWWAHVDSIKSASLNRTVKDQLERAVEWLGAGRGFFIHGDFNAGKSSIAAILAMEAMKRGEQVTWVPSRDVTTVMWRKSAKGGELYDRLEDSDVVVLDDLGAVLGASMATAAGEAFEQLVRIPYDQQRSLLVTSNLDWDDFVRDYKEDAFPLVSVLRRVVEPMMIVNDQWGGPLGGR